MIPARVERLLAARGLQVAAVLLVVGVAAVLTGGWLATHPPTTQVTDHTNVQTVETQLRPSAVVTGDTSLYERGTVLRDQPVYLLSAAPRLRLNLTTAIPGNGTANVNQRLEVVYRARQEGTTFWNESRVLANESTTVDEERATTGVTVSATALRENLTRYRTELSGAGSVSASIRLVVTYRTGEYEGRFTETVPLELRDSWYALDGRTLSKRHSDTVQRTVTVPRTTPARDALASGVGVASLFAGVAVAVVHRRRYRGVDGALAETVHHERYGEWISRGRVPEDAAIATVQMRSLEDLVDVGIDSGKRVVHDPDLEVFCVIDGEVLYYYRAATPMPDQEPVTVSETGRR